MPESAKLNEKVTKMQKDIEEIKGALRDEYYAKRPEYEKRLEDVLSKRFETVHLWLEIDGFRCTKEIVESLCNNGIALPTTTAWRLFKAMRQAGLINKVGTKGKSPIYDKILWAKDLELDDYIRRKYDL